MTRTMTTTQGLLLAMALSAGCVTTINTHRRTDDMDRGIQYFLPKTLVALRITYTVVDKVKYQSGVPSDPTRTIVIEKPITVETRLHPDSRHPLMIDPEGGDAAMLETKFGFRVGDSGLLLGVDSTVKDHSVEFVQQLVGTAISTAKLIATAVAGGRAPREELKTRIDAVTLELSQTSKETDAVKRLARVQTLQKELTALLAVEDALVKANRLDETRTDVVRDVLLDPGTFTPKAGWYESDEIVPLNQFQTADGKGMIDPALLPKVKVSVRLEESEFGRATAPILATGDVPGVLYRSAAPVETRVQVTAGGVVSEVGHAVLLMSQFGRVSVAPLRSKRAGDREIHATIGPAGGLTEYKVDSGSTADQMLQKISTSVDGLQKAVGEIRYEIPTDAAKAKAGRDKAVGELTNVTSETELLKAKIDNEQAKADLKKLQAENAESK